MVKAFFFDRDGIINKSIINDGKPYPPKSISEFEFTEGIQDLIHELNLRNFKIFIVTNQPDVRKNSEVFDIMKQFHEHIYKNLPIDEILFCPHDDSDQCQCRKPLPGMITSLMNKYQLSPQNCFMVGDRWRDIGAGLNSGVKSYFVDYSYSEPVKYIPDYRVQSISELHILLKQQGHLL